ncbi:HIT domain-containing protein [bacterium]|nr:HIT domain-containing protein [bacterium]
METLWAPWRMEFIRNLKDKYKEGCLFCNLHKSKDDESDLVLYRGKHSYVVMNRYPYNVGHVMVVPNKHTANLLELDSKTNAELLELAGKSAEIIQKEMNAEGFNMGFNFGRTAGAGIKEHLHLHVVPRWNGDTNFFPIFAKTKSMPEYLGDTYNRLKAYFDKIS